MMKPYIALPILFGSLFAVFLVAGLPYWAALIAIIGTTTLGFEFYLMFRYKTTLSERFTNYYRRNKFVAYIIFALFFAVITYLTFHLMGYY